MFSKKPEDANEAPAAEAGAEPLPAEAAVEARAAVNAPPIIPPRRPVIRPEVVRRSGEYPTGGSTAERPVGGYGEGKKLIVGRDIALSGTINACEKLIVEGRVEANISDCQEIEITDTGTFKGEAEIDVAEVSGAFEGTLIARELLLVRNTGRVNGNIRYGRLEVERGGQIDGDVRVYQEDAGKGES
jgi:cytoskeletal protein CcmA (bactofilin family)